MAPHQSDVKNNVVRLVAVFNFQSDIDKDSSWDPYILVQIPEVAAQQVARCKWKVLAEDIEILEHVSSLDDFKPPDGLSASLGLLVAVVHHGYQNIEQDDCRQTDIEGEDDLEQSHTVVQIIPSLVEEWTDTYNNKA